VKYLLKPGFWQSPDPLRLDLGFGIYDLSQTTKDVTAKLLFPAPRPGLRGIFANLRQSLRPPSIMRRAENLRNASTRR
jgi:hypothetical protein